MSRIKLSDRMAIEAGLYAKSSLTAIAKKIGESEKYVSEELRRNRTIVPGERVNENDCLYAWNCKRVKVCGDGYCKHTLKGATMYEGTERTGISQL